MIETRPIPSSERRTVAFLGLGVMGFPMAGHLAQVGHRVQVYNRDAAKSAAWLTAYAGSDIASAATPARGPTSSLVALATMRLCAP